MLRVRAIAVPDAARERILAEKDPGRLERALEKAIVAASVEEVLDEAQHAAVSISTVTAITLRPGAGSSARKEARAASFSV